MALFSLAKVLLPRRDTQHGYPLDLDGSLRYTRPFVIDPYPYPSQIGMVSGFMRQLNGFIFQTQATARTPYGPNINMVPNYAEYQIAVAGLSKRA